MYWDICLYMRPTYRELSGCVRMYVHSEAMQHAPVPKEFHALAHKTRLCRRRCRERDERAERGERVRGRQKAKTKLKTKTQKAAN